ncbi:carbohydrate ABC transporter permease [Thermocaproicibacter melissae]|jgi:putative aldouronate transport system permease protein|uniref:carbohydrate ABC transporter permease n=1 Tax=Thermocaproicibacter melissae TaxID=2966552 RepID=UPI0024B06C21|nr:carbohydrate ABC transporter permease [Thermocaproicibacter melissae]WBY63680.1 carbohydrate ABC transporter permease [Thermocaproicibacter melissae]
MGHSAVKKRYVFNRVSATSNALINLLFIIICVLFIAPMVLVVMVSFTSEKALLANGYQFWPAQFSTESYQYVFKAWKDILRCYGNSILVTTVGSFAATAVITLYAYPLSRSNFRHKNGFAFFAFFTTIFGGGLVPWVFIYAQFLKISDTLLVLIIPYLVNAWWIIIMRTFMKQSIPEELIEAARIDGAGEFRTFFSIALPLCKAGLATIFLFCMVKFWNDYYLSLIFINNHHLYTIQYYMYSLLNGIDQILSNTNVPPEARRNLPSEGCRMALAVIGVGPVVFTYPFFRKFFVKGLIIGAVKG